MFNKNNERPGFETYSAFEMPYSGMMMPMMPNFNNINGSNNCSQKLNILENKINNLENKIQKIENNMYPKASDTSFTYQNSMNMM